MEGTDMRYFLKPSELTPRPLDHVTPFELLRDPVSNPAFPDERQVPLPGDPVLRTMARWRREVR